jgi:hypothetical protein
VCLDALDHRERLGGDVVKKKAGKLHIKGRIRKSYTECGRVIAGGGMDFLDTEEGDLEDPRVCKWCRVTYESGRVDSASR